MKGHNKQLGAAGERRTAAYLTEHGYRVIAENYASPFGEIDLIAVKEDVLAFVEVKTRTTEKFGAPRLAVTREKQRRIAMTAMQYLQKNDVGEMALRFDVAEVTSAGVRYLPDAFRWEE